MRSSILIAFLVVAISSSTYGVNNIFDVEINTKEFHTLKAEQVDAEVKTKLDLVAQIVALAEKVPVDERAWLNEFKNMVTAEVEIIEKLNLPLSQLNTDNLENINDEELRKKISDEVYEKLQKGLKDYLKMLKTFDFSQTVWEGHSFLGNPFEEFMDRMTAANPEGLKAATLKEAFKKAAADVIKAKKAIISTMTSLKNNLASQYTQSQTVMMEIRDLNLLAVPSTEKKVKKSVTKLATKLKKLQSSLENINKIPAGFECFMNKRAWIDEIRIQLMNLDTVHANLNIRLARV